MNFKYPLFRVDFKEDDKLNLNSILDSGWISPGAYTKELEELYTKSFVPGFSSMTTSSCTTSLALSIHLMDIKEGDEVLVAGVNFIAVVNAILNVKAVPIFVDCISSNNPNISISDLKAKYSRKTKAVIVVHFAGYASDDIYDIKNFCISKNIYLLEDVAHAPLAKFKDNAMAGSVGHFSCFSFFSNKNIPAGEGGMLCSAQHDVIDRARKLKSHGMSVQTQDRYKKSALLYDVVEPGFNYRMPELSCGIALSQAKKYLKTGLHIRRDLISHYRKSLQKVNLDLIFDESADKYAAPHIAVCLLPEGVDKQKVQERLNIKKIQTSMHYPNFDSFTATKKLVSSQDLVNCSKYVSRCITLPFYESLTYDDISEICSVVGDIISDIN
jgi:dTDP-4-amino-4,6-dideoxygalactose transaminase